VRGSRLVPLALAAVALLIGSRGAQARYEGNFNLFVGQKWLNTGDWAPVDQQQEIGLMLAFGEEREAVHFALDFFYAEDDQSGATPALDSFVKSVSAEFGLGIRKVWMGSATHPHLGAGADVIEARECSDGPSGPSTQSDRGYGIWVDAGVTWRLARHLNLGIEARYSVARVDVGSQFVPHDVGGGGVHVGALLGYGW
jgi:hypothetical protein